MRFPPGIAPALFTSMSRPGKAAAILSTLALSERSAANTSTRTFDLRAISACAALRSAAVRATSTTLQPSSAMALAVARPMPLEAPVMRAVLPASLRSMVALEGFGGGGEPRPYDRPRAEGNRAVPSPLPQAAKPARWRGNEARRGPHHRGAAPGGVRRVARRAAVRRLR